MAILSNIQQRFYLVFLRNEFNKAAVHRNYSKKFEDIPGPYSLPAVGTLYQYLPAIGNYKFTTLHHNGFKKYKKYGEVVREEIVPGVNVVWLFNPRDIETMFRNEGKYPQRRSHLALEKYRLDRPNVYNSGGLLPTNGEEWSRIRTVLQKGLSSPQSVLNFLQKVDEIVLEWLSNLHEVCNEHKDMLPELSRLYLEIIVMAVLDIRLNSFSRRERKYYSRSSKLIQAALVTNSCILKTDNGPQLWKKFDTPLYRKLKKSQEYMEDVAIDLLSLQMSLFHEKERNTPATLLESYLAAPELDFKDIIGMACDFILAGIDTTTYTTSFMLYHLAKAQGVQSNLFREVRRLLPNTYSKVTKEVLQEAVYAKAVLKETLRLRPISVGTGRVLQNDAEFSGYMVPKETVVVSQNQVICRLPEYFPSPTEFKPERWLKDHPLYKKPDPFLVLPFGHGPRSCIARRLAEQNMLVLLLKMIRNYHIQWTGNFLDSQSLLINKPDGPILLKLNRRND
ncbi:cytochrome P450 302a1, mitochondrial [Aethina tumida]|uniref:cytochrome P450 302a1, mitochondrial n=1 Tax=Aethina tumida TaxID=116153 RepID=UPI00096B285F|nr:cytochrome P450 302a1, mitochondrial [Aethina tumida]XP_049822685.1 cytochrome P450 302a1, mitochondrial [Aethina tumida]